MSFLKTTGIQHLNGTNNNITLDSAGNVYTSGLIYRNTLFNYSGTITFTPCGATGRMGPTLAQARSSYTSEAFQSSWLNDLNLFWVEQGIQYWVVPKTGTYTITAMGAGGSVNSIIGTGAKVSASFLLNAGERLRIVVGQSGLINTVGSYLTSYGAAGASCVSVYRNNTEQLLIVGGGGAGKSNNSDGSVRTIRNAQYTNSGIPEGGFGSVWEVAYSSSTGLVNFWPGGGGGGWMRPGSPGGIGDAMTKKNNHGDALIHSALGGYSEAGSHGGFGGGGASGRDGGAAGGGGGYNGGHAEAWNGSNANDYAQGGTCYVGLGATQTNVLNNNTGQGAVTITL